MAIPSRITLVTLGVDDVARATAFYEGLGWSRSSASVEGEVSFFTNAGSRLALWKVDELRSDAGFELAAVPAFRAVAMAINCDSPEDVDEVIATAAALGGVARKPAKPTEWGGYSGYFTDLDGHLWEVAHNPFWETGDDGLPKLPI